MTRFGVYLISHELIHFIPHLPIKFGLGLPQMSDFGPSPCYQVLPWPLTLLHPPNEENGSADGHDPEDNAKSGAQSSFPKLPGIISGADLGRGGCGNAWSRRRWRRSCRGCTEIRIRRGYYASTRFGLTITAGLAQRAWSVSAGGCLSRGVYWDRHNWR